MTTTRTPRSATRSIRRSSIGLAAVAATAAVGLGGYDLASAEISSGDRPVFVPIEPCRLVDTRAAATVGPRGTPLGGDDTLAVRAHGSNGECTGASSIPSDAVALSLNVTAVRPSQRTFLTLWGDGADPGTSNLNPEPGEPPTPNAVNTPLSAGGSFNLRNDRGSVDVIIDVNGFYAPHDHADLYLTRPQLDARYVTDAELSSELDGYATDAELTAALDSYVTEAALGAELDGYTTEAELAAALDDYVTTATLEDYVTTAELDGYVADTELAAVVDGLGGTTFLARGTAGSTGAGDATVDGLAAPSGVDAEISRSDVGTYTVTLTGLAGPIATPTVQLTAFFDGTDARACSLASTGGTATTSTFDVVCFGENPVDADPNDIVNVDARFQFLLLG